MIKKCLLCNDVLERKSKQWSRQIYCSSKCRKVAHRDKQVLITRIEQKRSNLRQNDEVLYLIRQCRQASTVQIFKGHDLKSFTETMKLIKNRPLGEINLCHIAPVKGKNSTGLLHCMNLFYGGAHQNKKFGNKYISGGLSIGNEELIKDWEVNKAMSNNDVLVVLEKYLKDIIPQYIAINPVRKSRKASIVNKIIAIDDSKRFDELISLDYRSLGYMWAAISKTTPAVLPNIRHESKYLAYMESISRFISYGGDRTSMLKSLRKLMVIAYMALERVACSKTYNKYFYVKYEDLIQQKYGQVMLKNPNEWSGFKDFIYQTAFETLQGKDLKIRKFRKLVMSYLVFPEKAWTVRN